MHIFNTLLLQDSTETDRAIAVQNLIEIHQFPFNCEKWNAVFKAIRTNLLWSSFENNHQEYIQLFDQVLKDNKDLLIAILLAFNQNFVFGLHAIFDLLRQYRKQNEIACNHEKTLPYLHAVTDSKQKIISSIFQNSLPIPEKCLYSRMQELHRFNVDNLSLPKEHKIRIEKYCCAA